MVVLVSSFTRVTTVPNVPFFWR